MISIVSWARLLFNNVRKTLEASVSSPSPTLVVQAGFWSSVQWWSLSSPSWPEGPKPFAGRWPSCHSCWALTSCTCAFPGSDLTDNRGSSELFSFLTVSLQVGFISPSGSSSAWSISSLVSKLTNHSNDLWSLLIQMKSTCGVQSRSCPHQTRVVTLQHDG